MYPFGVKYCYNLNRLQIACCHLVFVMKSPSFQNVDIFPELDRCTPCVFIGTVARFSINKSLLISFGAPVVLTYIHYALDTFHSLMYNKNNLPCALDTTRRSCPHQTNILKDKKTFISSSLKAFILYLKKGISKGEILVFFHLYSNCLIMKCINETWILVCLQEHCVLLI